MKLCPLLPMLCEYIFSFMHYSHNDVVIRCIIFNLTIFTYLLFMSLIICKRVSKPSVALDRPICMWRLYTLMCFSWSSLAVSASTFSLYLWCITHMLRSCCSGNWFVEWYSSIITIYRWCYEMACGPTIMQTLTCDVTDHNDATSHMNHWCHGK